MVSTGNVSYEDSLNNINAPFFQNRNIKTIAQFFLNYTWNI
ncbi:endo-beta-N-acetylglucosaminidase [Clostridium perfringens]|nr:hypothetical protein [Clostridium perfringens]